MSYCINCYCATCMSAKAVDFYSVSSGDQLKIRTVFPINTIEIKDEKNNVVDKSLYVYLYYDANAGYHYFCFIGDGVTHFLKKTPDNISELVILPKQSN